MSILGNIMSKVFGHNKPTATHAAPTPVPSAAPTAVPTAPAPGAATATIAPPVVDVEEILEGLAAKQSHEVNWRHSIVDLMSLLGIDNSLAERRALAHELGYTGDTQDTATMNMWLHKQVLRKLAENGGKVPADLMH